MDYNGPTKHVLSLGGGETRPLTGVTADDIVAGWSDDGRSLFVHKRGTVPSRLERVDPATGRRELIRELAPPDRSGLLAAGDDVSLVNDARAYAYSYARNISRLVVVKGPPSR